MMRNEYFSDGYFEGYDWAIEQTIDDLATLAARVEAKITSIPFSNGEDARQWREGFTSGVKSVFRERLAAKAASKEEDSDESANASSRKSALCAA